MLCLLKKYLIMTCMHLSYNERIILSDRGADTPARCSYQPGPSPPFISLIGTKHGHVSVTALSTFQRALSVQYSAVLEAVFMISVQQLFYMLFNVLIDCSNYYRTVLQQGHAPKDTVTRVLNLGVEPRTSMFAARGRLPDSFFLILIHLVFSYSDY